MVRPFGTRSAVQIRCNTSLKLSIINHPRILQSLISRTQKQDFNKFIETLCNNQQLQDILFLLLNLNML
jgi:hypothetical protein